MKKFLALCLTLFLVLVASAAAQLSATTSLDLGTVAVGGTASSTFTLTNSDAASVDVTYGNVQFTGTAGTFTGTVTATPTTVSASSSVTVNLDVAVPASAPTGSYTGDLTVTDAANSTNTATVALTLVVSDTHSVVVSGGDVLVDITYEDLNDNEREVNVSQDIVVSNDGVFTEDVTLATTNLQSDVIIDFSTSSFTLAPGETRTVTLDISIPVEFDSGLTQAGQIVVGFNSGADTTTVDVDADVEPMLRVTDLDVEVAGESDKNLDDGDKISEEGIPDDEVILTFTVDNLFDKDYSRGDLSDVTINVILDEDDEDDFGDDIDQDSNEVDIDAGEDEQDIEVKFDIPEDAEEGTYTLIITVEGDDDNDATHLITMTVDLEVDLQKDDVRITSMELGSGTLQCTRQTTLNVRVENKGSDNQDDVVLRLNSGVLGIDETREFELDEAGDDDDDKRVTFDIDVADDVAAGLYRIEGRVFINGDDLDDETHVNVRVNNCGATTPTPTPVSQPTTPEPTTVIVSPPVTQPTPTPTPVSQQTTGSDSGSDDSGASDDDVFEVVDVPFTQTPAFIVLLILANIVVLAVIVLVVVKLVRK